jgi:hypothetical protein
LDPMVRLWTYLPRGSNLVEDSWSGQIVRPHVASLGEPGMKLTRTILVLAAVGHVFVNSAGAADLRPAVGAAPLPPAELRAIYAGNTWVWEDGGGFFGQAGEFLAYTQRPDGRVEYGQGTWSIRGGGVMCFGGVWQSNGADDFERCFGHMRADGLVYQRAHPDGEWYVFAHRPPQPEDEIRMVRQGDLVTPQLQRLRRR